MSIKIKLEVFEGPFDLLFHLIEKAEVDIYDIPISEITDQYLEHLNLMKKLDLEIASEFLVMASTLLEIKSKMLLPKQKINNIDETDIDPRDELVQKLIEYKKYKEASVYLKEKMTIYEKVYYKIPEPIELYLKDFNEMPHMEIDSLIKCFQEILKRNDKKINSIRKISREQVTVEEKMEEIEMLLMKKSKFFFEEAFSEFSTKHEIITTFLALLELIKRHAIIIRQENNFDKILVISVNNII